MTDACIAETYTSLQAVRKRAADQLTLIVGAPEPSFAAPNTEGHDPRLQSEGDVSPAGTTTSLGAEQAFQGCSVYRRRSSSLPYAEFRLYRSVGM